MQKTQSQPPKLPGRPTLLTPDVQAAIVAYVWRGYTVASAARLTGVNLKTVKHWIWRGRHGRGEEFANFTNLLSEAVAGVRESRIHANPRAIRRARTERQEPDHVIRQLAYKELHRVVDEGRVPDDVAREALQMVMDDIEDKIDLHEERRTWEDVDRDDRRN